MIHSFYLYPHEYFFHACFNVGFRSVFALSSPTINFTSNLPYSILRSFYFQNYRAFLAFCATEHDANVWWGTDSLCVMQSSVCNLRSSSFALDDFGHLLESIGSTNRTWSTHWNRIPCFIWSIQNIMTSCFIRLSRLDSNCETCVIISCCFYRCNAFKHDDRLQTWYLMFHTWSYNLIHCTKQATKHSIVHLLKSYWKINIFFRIQFFFWNKAGEMIFFNV